MDSLVATLNEKEYTNDGVNWFINGVIDNQKNRITLYPRLFNMHNTTYQADWLDSVSELKLKENTDMANSGFTIHFKVPTGQEKYWRFTFNKSTMVKWAELNFYANIEPF